MLTVHDPSLSPTTAAQAAIAQFAAQRFAEIAKPEHGLVYTLFDNRHGAVAVAFIDRHEGNWLTTEDSPTLDQLGLLCLEATCEGLSVIVTKHEALATGLLDEHAVVSALDISLDIPRSEWHGADWRELVSSSDEDDGDDVSYITVDLADDDDMAQFG
jgi:hypothetical protein